LHPAGQADCGENVITKTTPAAKTLTEPLRHGEHPDTGERAYSYAKACVIIGKSFIGKRLSALGKLQTIKEFDRLVFPESSRDLPGKELLSDIENRISRRTVRHILSVIKAYSQPPELLVRQLRACEYADVKTCLHYIESDKTHSNTDEASAPPALSDTGRFGTVSFEKYPDLAAMLTGTEFEFILEKDLTTLRTSEFDRTSLDAELDLRYYTLLAASARRLPSDDRIFTEHIIGEEISLRNCVWAFRLRTYFQRTPRQTAEHLMNLTMQEESREIEGIPGEIGPRISYESGVKPTGEISLSAEARESLHLPLDSRSEWKNWRWEKFLNPEKADEENWMVNPRHFQNAASQYLYHLSLRCFRLMPLTITAIFCFIKLKQFEEDILTSVAEGLGLGMTGADVFDLLEVPQ